MLRFKYLLLLILLLGHGNLPGQGYKVRTIHWKVIDKQISESFLNTYIDSLSLDDRRENQIQSSFTLFITVKTSFDSVILKKIEALDPDRGYYYKLSHSVLDQLKKSTTLLTQRQYEWDNVNLKDRTSRSFPGEVRNVFEERNYKLCRDIYWWTYRGFKFSPGLTSYIRPKQFSQYAFEVDFGRSDLGFPGGGMNTMNIGLVNEIAKAFLTLPVKYFSIGNFIPIQGGKFGFGIHFDSPNFGGSVSYQDVNAFIGEDLSEDVAQRVYNTWASQIYFSNTFNIAQASRTAKPDSSAGKKFRLPPTSLRIKAGMGYMNMVYLRHDSTNSNLVISHNLEQAVNNLQFVLRLEFVTDGVKDKDVNKHLLALQTNLWLGGLGNIQINYSYGLKDFLNLGVVSTFYWNDLAFESEIYKWAPGWMFMPYFSLSF